MNQPQEHAMRRTRRFSPLFAEALEDRVVPAFLPWGPSRMREPVAAFTDLVAIPDSERAGTPNLSLTDMRAVSVDPVALTAALKDAPFAAFGATVTNPITVSLPTPDGKAARFQVWEVSITEPGYVSLNPEMKFYRGVGIDDPYASLAADNSLLGFHGSIRSPNGNWYIDPYYHLSQSVYAVYERADVINLRGGECGCGECTGVVTKTEDTPAGEPNTVGLKAPPSDGITNSFYSNGNYVREFKLAVAATVEFTAYSGGTVAKAQAAIESIVNRVNQVYEAELAVRLNLVYNNTNVIFVNDDDYTNSSLEDLLDENQDVLDDLIGNAGYNVGHVFGNFGSGFSGLATLGSAGLIGVKGRGASRADTPSVANHGFVECVLHELGHQFGAMHTFNGLDDANNASGLSANREAGTAYEPGNGTTIMSYGYNDGTNPANDVQGKTDDYFHIISLSQITDHLNNVIPNHGTKAAVNNFHPVVDAGPEYTIPLNTPFELKGTATDLDSTNLLYTWEQFDVGPSQVLGSPDNGSSPLFRSVAPSTTGNVRSFPKLQTVLAGKTGSNTEVAVTVPRTMNFRLTARDTAIPAFPGTSIPAVLGTYDSDSTRVHAVATNGATFGITNFNSFVDVYSGSTQTLEWSVAGTTGYGINVSQVHIDLSVDGGATFSPLSEFEQNDGKATVTLPATATTAARFRIRAVGNIFYDISNADFQITVTPTSFTVTNANESGPGSLRDAIAQANKAPNPQMIYFSSLFDAPQTITLTSPITIAGPVTIYGHGSDKLTINGTTSNRLFDLQPVGPDFNITFRGVTLANGKAARGGAIFVYGADLTLEDSIIRDCFATDDGGAIHFQGPDSSLTLRRTTLRNNTATDDGGAIHMLNGGRVAIIDSAIVHNTASTGTGGALDFSFTADSFVFTGSTIANNSSSLGGGGVMLNNFTGALNVNNSTITGNSTQASAGGITRSGGTGSISVFSSIVSGNTGSSPDIDTAGTVAINASAIGSTAGFTFTGGGNLIGQNLKLRPLAGNGGPTPTVAFDYDSPLRGIGNSTAAYDARGFARNNNGVDIGAFELQTTVTTTDDIGDGTLLYAVMEANRVAGPDTITFNSLFSTPQTIAAYASEFPLNETVTILGPGSGLLTLSGGNAYRHFNTDLAPAGAVIDIRGLSLMFGSGSEGGSIYVGDESLTIQDCVIVANSATQEGGAIHVQNGGSLTLLRTTVSGNIATNDGGGIYFNNGGSVDIRESAIVNNIATTGMGGGLYFFGATGVNGVLVTSSTIANNTAQTTGGGIQLQNFSGAINVGNSTITANSSTTGGGIARSTGTGSINLANSVVSNNMASGAPDIATVGTVNANTSAIGNAGGLALSGSDNLIGQNLKLRPLTNNGGPTPSVAFDSDSPLRDRSSSNVSSTDQRGFPRNNNGVDIGAFELQTTVINTNDSGAGSLRDAVAESNRVVGTETITFASTSPQTITLLGGEIALSDSVIIQGAGASLTTISGNSTSRIFNTTGVAAGKTVTLRGVTLTAGRGIGVNGGAILTDDEHLIVEDSVLSKSYSSLDGGAISMGTAGKLTLSRSSLVGNSVSSGAGGRGGAIRMINGGNSVITDSAFIGNTAISGGAIHIDGQGSAVTILNSTLSGNSASTGGGIALDNFIGALTVRNATLTNNTGNTSGGGLSSTGGSPNINIESTVIANNGAPNGPDISSNTTVTVNRSAIGLAGGFTLTGSNNIPFNTNPKLAALANNGGPTLTHLPASDSPLVNAGSNPANLSLDQRGVNRTLYGTTDIGSVEVTTTTPPDTTAPSITLITSDTPNGTYGVGQTIDIRITLSEPVTLVGTLNVLFNNGGVGTFSAQQPNFVTLTGSYSVAAGQSVADLNVTSLTLTNGSTLRDAVGNNAVFTLPTSNFGVNKDIVITTPPPPDVIAPTIASITSPTPNGTYQAGATIGVNVNFSEPVTLSGFLFVFFDIGGSLLIQGPQTGSTLSGTYTVGSNQNSPDLNVTAVALDTTSSVQDAAGNAANLALPASNLANNSNIIVGTPVANTFTVTNTNNAGNGSLRQAVLDANASPGFDVIAFDASFNTSQTITLSSSLDITEAVAIAGKGSTITTIQGNGSTRLIRTDLAPANAAINISGLTLSGGRAANGAGVFIADERVAFTNSVLSNHSGSGTGGAIIVQGGGTIILNATTLSGNTASFGGGIGIFNGSADIQNSAILNNTAGNNQGGGLYFSGTVGNGGFKIVNSTVSGNKAATYGGAVGLRSFTGKFEAISSTLTNNTSSYLGGGISRHDTGSGTIFLRSSIVSGNSANVGGHDLYSTTIVDAFFSAIGKSGGFTLSTSNGFNLPYNTDLKLGTLTNNGGPTLTYKPAGDSPLLNAGTNYSNVATDQRGSGFPRQLDNAPDIGSVEVPFVLPTIVLNTNDNGAGSLRQAILNANSNPGADTISFDPTVFAVPRTIALTSGQLTIADTTGATTITGPGSSLVTISGSSVSRVFIINSGVTAGISGVTVANGKSIGDAGAGLQNNGTVTIQNTRFTNNKADVGGAIYNVGTLSVSNSTFDANAATTGSGFGGAIFNSTALTISGCTFTANTASVLGGAITANGTASIANSTFTNNTSALNGGAVRLHGTVTISNSTFSGNSAANDGGALMNHGTVTLTNCTLANNTASIGGGAYIFDGSATLRNVTVAYNSSTNTAGNIGGGIHVGTAPNVIAVNTIVAGNNAASGLNVGGLLAAGSTNNVLNMSAAAAGLGSLANNGGLTQTIPIAANSPAINAGTAAGVPTSDQRGFPRAGAPDIGAYELQASNNILGIVINDGAVQRSRVTKVQLFFATPVDVASLGAVFLLRDGGGSVGVGSGLIVSPASGNTNSLTLTFGSGPDLDFGSLRDGRWTITFGGTGYVSSMFHRLYGDINGDGQVDGGTDFAQFAIGNLTPITAAFDFNNDGTIDGGTDFAQFGTRFGRTI